MAAIPHIKCDLGSGRENTAYYESLFGWPTNWGGLQYLINGWLISFELGPTKANIRVTNISKFCKILIDTTTFVLFPNIKALQPYVF